MDDPIKDINVKSLVESCRPSKKRGRPSHKRQLLEIREEGKLNLQTSDSVVTTIQLRSILTNATLQSLPKPSQIQLIRLLPDFDQIRKHDGSIEASDTALSNEYFRRFCIQFQEKLADNKFSSEAIEQAKIDTSKELAKLDPWKLRNFEPTWGQKLISQTVDSGDENVRLERLMKQNRIRKPQINRVRERPASGRKRIKKKFD